MKTSKSSARLVEGLSVVGVFASLLGLIFLIFMPREVSGGSNVLTLAVASIPIITSFFSILFCRMGLFHLGGVLLLLGAFISLIAQVVINPHIEIARSIITFFYLIPLCCSLIFSWSLTLIVALCSAIALCMIQKSVPQLSSHELIIQLISVFAGAGLAIVGSFTRDATENDLEIQRAKLMTSSKLSALGTMSVSIAHEINNPLTIIQGKASQLSKIIQARQPTDDVGIEYLDKIISTSNRISKIIKGLRSFSRNADNDPLIRVDLKTLIENVLGLYAESLKIHQIDLQISSIPDLAVECRGVQIEQVIFNLLNNSYDAVDNLSEKWIRLEFKVFSKMFQIIVTDSGSGIPPIIAKRLMEPFYTTKEAGKGIGLGLSISKSIIQNHQGDLRYDSTCLNTCFVIELPRAYEHQT